jgi:hypothetical protein
MRCIEQYGRCIKQSEFLVEMCNRCLDHPGRASIATVRPV